MQAIHSYAHPTLTQPDVGPQGAVGVQAVMIHIEIIAGPVHPRHTHLRHTRQCTLHWQVSAQLCCIRLVEPCAMYVQHSTTHNPQSQPWQPALPPINPHGLACRWPLS